MMMRRLIAAPAALLFLAALLIAPRAEAAHAAAPPDRSAAAYSCALGGRLGNPTLRNVGPRDFNTVRRSLTNQNKIYVGSPERWCPTHIYVHWGYDIQVSCSNGYYYWRTGYGWRELHEMCSWGGGSSTISFREYRE